MRTRCITIQAKGANSIVNVFVEIADLGNNLTRVELVEAGTALADAIMLAIPETPFVGVPLSKIRVR